MHISRLKIQNLRVLRSIDVRPDRSLNVIYGDNGSGKTSFLEAIYLLGQGRSFRSRLSRDVITRKENSLVVYADLYDVDGRTEALGVEKTVSESRYRCSGEDIKSASALARLIPTLLLTPDSYRLLTDGGRLRRRTLDWALFHVEPAYNGILQNYRLALRQRNAQLRQDPQPGVMQAWSVELSRTANHVHQFRQGLANAVTVPLHSLIDELLGRDVTVRYKPGWDTESDLSDLLISNLAKDVARGFTSLGPHRADIQFLVDGRPAQNVLSRGEGKLFVACVLLAYTGYVASRSQDSPVVLVDDLASELDYGNRGKLLDVLTRFRTQVFLTATAKEALSLPDADEKTLFHVEQGSVTKVL